MADLVEAKRRLQEIKRMANNRTLFNDNTMFKIETWAKEVKSLGNELLEQEDEVFYELDAAITISKDYHDKNLGIENEMIKDALIHLEYAVDLFLERYEYFKI